jgi:CO/xanthine dehydrogenase Mo-binding subunit
MFGGSVQSFDASQALEIEGVQDVIEISRGVAVVADNTWAAFKGAKALDITWNPGGFAMSSSDITESFVELSEQDGAVARNDGDAEAALQQADQYLEATYEVPYLAHATMEPMNCTADVRSDRCEIWAPTQGPQRAQSTASQLTGLPMEAVTVHVTLMGCGLGRRSRDDFVRDAVETSMQVGAPVQVIWTREEDMQHDFYRPALYSRLEGGLDATGQLMAWKSRMVAPPVGGGRGGGGNQADYSSVDGVANLPYSIPNFFVDNCRSDVPVPTGHWRSVGVSQNTFIAESFIDELAHAAGRDPFEFRYELLSQRPRIQRVLTLAAEQADWGTPLPEGWARGMALVENKGSLVAEVAEVSLRDGRVHVHRVTCAVDCGQVIHPGIVEAQMAGSIVNGLTAALYGEITLEDGRVAQSNFHDYQMLRMDEMPAVEVHIVESAGEPGAVGEPGLPPIAPAVTNALFALTGTRIRRLPIQAATL